MYIFIILILFTIGYKLLTLKALASKEDLQKLLKNGAVIIDVRSESEFNTNHIHSARNIPHLEVELGIKKLNIDKDSDIILYCASGARSASSLRVLKALGYINAVNAGSIYRLGRITGF